MSTCSLLEVYWSIFYIFLIWYICSWLHIKVREDQEKRMLEEDLQSQALAAQQPGQQSSTEMPLSQPMPEPAPYVPPQANQPNSQPSIQQSLQSSNTSQSSQLSGTLQGGAYVPQSAGQVSVQAQSVVTNQVETEEPEADKQLQHTGGSKFQRWFIIGRKHSTSYNIKIICF